jgi:hypothetical protein
VDHWLNLDIPVSLLLGIALSAACGFRIFLPFLLVSAMALFGQVELPSDLSWLDSERALLVLGIAGIVEMIAYYIPFIDNLLDPIALPLATVAGTLVTAFTLPEMNEILKWTLAAIVGGGAAGSIKGTAGVSRLGSTFLSGGWGNFLLSTAEWLGASLLTVFALTVPVGAGIGALVLLGVAIFQFWPRISRRFFPPPPPRT